MTDKEIKGINIVLVEPEIPQNTGNIVRTCGGIGAHLHLVKPLGFEVTDKHLKRAGLDYWHMVDITYYDNFKQLLEKYGADCNFYYCTTKGARRHTQVEFKDGDFLVFGKESRGLPENLLAEHYDECIRIPMRPDFRSLNLSNAVAVVAFEAMRQLDFAGMEEVGALTGRPEFAD
ncbi:MAG: tRNA (uridine(34)/cytosine(34)/5-carboxymethylaminomethyluridine(34)-2'-O)-methyltransferase TrmL [Ruminococcaceae bacterium]|nr:tRNA (uridine(34)/cytosine(34)/5-carboxymethylaminomethyluridine(34)-2'-O)-methyltransferase TrmL [Oscillospiraceae bacterium]